MNFDQRNYRHLQVGRPRKDDNELKYPRREDADQKRIKIIDNFFKEKIGPKTFREENFNGIFYYNGKQAVTDILNYYLIKSKKNSENIQRLLDFYKDKTIPKMPVGAEFLMKKFNIPEGKQLGAKLKIIEEEWVKNNFQISDKQVSQIVNN